MLVVKHPKPLALLMLGVATFLFLASLGSAPGSYADDPTATPIRNGDEPPNPSEYGGGRDVVADADS